MRLWLDDERPMPSDWEGGRDDWVTTSTEAINRLTVRKAAGVRYEEMSFDHDLGGKDTSMRVLDWMVENNYWPKEITIHTANPPARQNMLRLINRYAPFDVDIHIRYW